MSPRIEYDLAQGSPAQMVEADVCVIGAGPVGLCVTRALAGKHRRVILLEAGPFPAEQQSDNREVVFDRRPYGGATVGRAFGAGGTSSLWGGQLLPVRETDLLGRPQIGAPAWPLAYQELAPHFAVLETWLRVIPGGYARPREHPRHPVTELQWGEWTPRFSKWTPFGRRNVYAAFNPALQASRLVRAYLNARAGQWQLQPAADRQRVVEVAAMSPNGHAVSVRAKAYVICAGALESARCVLEMSDACGGLAAGVRDLTGRFLHDHLSVRLARVQILDHAGFQRLFAPIFVGETMRSLRMELSSDFLSQEGLPALYAHFLFEAAADSGFAVVRDVLRGLQRGKIRSALARASRLPAAIPEVAELLADRYLRRRLSFPRNADVFLQCDFEQAPDREGRVYLGREGSEGRRKLHIDWDLGGNTAHVARRVQSAMAHFWSTNKLDRFARLESVVFEDGERLPPNNLYDLYHPAGTARMSTDSTKGVVNADLRIHGTSNAYVAGSAVFPSIGAANPTFTAMALGLRLAEFIDRDLTAA